MKFSCKIKHITGVYRDLPEYPDRSDIEFIISVKKTKTGTFKLSNITKGMNQYQEKSALDILNQLISEEKIKEKSQTEKDVTYTIV